MLELNKKYDIKIDKLSYGADGIGRYDDMVIFVPNVVPGDVVRAKIVNLKKNYANAELVKVIEPSEDRVTPVCGLAKVCGGCQWMHIDYEAQLKYKKQCIEDCLTKMAKIDTPVNDVIPSIPNLEYRCKVQYPIAQTKNSKRYLAGYYKKGTHEIINIKKCAIQPDIINEITDFLREEAQHLQIPAYYEKKHKGLIRHFIFRSDKTNDNILFTFVLNSKNITKEIKQLANNLKQEFPQIKGIVANFNDRKTNLILGHNSELLCGVDHIIEELDGRKFKISAGSFFQVNPSNAINMFNTVREMIVENHKDPTILDIYAGVGTFAIWMKDIAKSIMAIEELPKAIQDAKDNLLLNEDIKGANIELVTGDAKEALKSIVEKEQDFDVIILDPPRKGCEKEALELISNVKAKHIIYVSCNPSTLARDLEALKEAGYESKTIQPIDMFPHTYHVESIVLLEKM